VKGEKVKSERSIAWRPAAPQFGRSLVIHPVTFHFSLFTSLHVLFCFRFPRNIVHYNNPRTGPFVPVAGKTPRL
jgi:hypothetical protein